MPPLNKRKKHLLKAYLARKEKQNRLTTDSMSNDKLIKAKQELIDKINNLLKEQISKCSKLLDTMVYPNVVHKDKILSPYLQKKAIDLILLTKGKPDSDALNIKNKINSLNKENKN